MKFSHSLTFKLARAGFVLAFGLGALLSGAQVYVDFREQDRAAREEISRVLQVSEPTAARAVHTLDENLAQEVVGGLLAYPYVFEATIVDELAHPLAKQHRPLTDSATRDLTQWLGGDQRQLHVPLDVSSLKRHESGLLSLGIDRDAMLKPFYERALFVFVAGFFRNLLLIVLFFLAFYWMVAKPLVRLSRTIRTLDPERGELSPIAMPARHADDEIGQLTRVSNEFVVAMMTMMSAKDEATALLLEKERHLHLIIDSVPHMIFARNARGRFVFANRATADAYGLAIDELTLKSLDALHRHVSTQELAQFQAADERIIQHNADAFWSEETFTDQAGKQRILQTYRVGFDYAGETVALTVAMDVTAQKEAEAQIKHLAYHDPLTNLPNRLRLIDVLKRESERSIRHGYVGAVLFIDLDHFKNINDSLGHPVGDLVLQEVARRLLSSTRAEDVICRLGGDEFVIVAPELSDSLSQAAANARDIAEKMRETLALPIASAGQYLQLTASIGIVLFPEGHQDAFEILRFADTAMYHAKKEGRDTIEFFSETMSSMVNRHLRLENELRQAIDREEFTIHFQPKVACDGESIVGAEVLIRWQHPDDGLISPAEFIPILESSRLIIPVGNWLMKKVFCIVKEWSTQGLWSADYRVGINISPRQFRDKHFVRDVLALLETTEVDPNLIEFEITEGIVIHDVESTIAVMRVLTQRGLAFSLDDFGTGYSSLSYLKRLPVHALKIDQAFVRDITSDPNDAAIVEATLAMARGLGLDVVAEGVETDQQLRFLLAHRCQYYQGYLFSRPVERRAFEALLTSSQAATA